MSANAIAQIVVYLVVLTFLAIPLGTYMAHVYMRRPTFASRVLGSLEAFTYRVARVNPTAEMTWKTYAFAVLVFNLAGMLLLYGLLRLQGSLPGNPLGLGGVGPAVSFNTAISFATNTNWQAYSGETTLTFLTQCAGLTVQNFLSAATGMCVLVALIRGIARKATDVIGNFWVDLTRTTLYILLPLSVALALALVSQGVVQTFTGAVIVPQAEQTEEQTIALGPVASQIAIKQLGTNGGGFYNTNSAHPLENPTPLSNFFEMLAILLIPAALCFTFGALVHDRRQGVALFVAMMVVFVPLVFATVASEAHGGIMEGKEIRFGITNSALWATATTAASNGSVNAMHDSFTPLGGLIPMWLMQLGEVIFGGVGSGLYGMLAYAFIAVFVAGLMVGRSPEYLGKKIDAHEMKMASLVILFPAAAVLIGTAIACVVPDGIAALGNPGVHGFSEILYAFSSGANNNGSAFGGLTVSGTFYASAIGVCMLIGRYWVIIPVLAMAGSLAKKNIAPATAGTLPTHTPLFVAFLVGTVLLVGALTFAPALALGPVIEHLQLSGASSEGQVSR